VDHGALLVLTGVTLPLGLLILPLAVVKYAADRRVAVGIYLYEVEPGFSSLIQGVGEGNNPYVLSVRPYKTDLSRSDPFVNPKLAEDRLAPLLPDFRHVVANIAHPYKRHQRLSVNLG
jgi:hypothetical protein